MGVTSGIVAPFSMAGFFLKEGFLNTSNGVWALKGISSILLGIVFLIAIAMMKATLSVAAWDFGFHGHYEERIGLSAEGKSPSLP